MKAIVAGGADFIGSNILFNESNFSIISINFRNEKIV